MVSLPPQRMVYSLGYQILFGYKTRLVERAHCKMDEARANVPCSGRSCAMGEAIEIGSGSFGVGVLRANEGTASVVKVNVRLRGFRGTCKKWSIPGWETRPTEAICHFPTFAEGLLSWASRRAGLHGHTCTDPGERGLLQKPAEVGIMVRGLLGKKQETESQGKEHGHGEQKQAGL